MRAISLRSSSPVNGTFIICIVVSVRHTSRTGYRSSKPLTYCLLFIWSPSVVTKAKATLSGVHFYVSTKITQYKVVLKCLQSSDICSRSFLHQGLIPDHPNQQTFCCCPSGASLLSAIGQFTICLVSTSCI